MVKAKPSTAKQRSEAARKLAQKRKNRRKSKEKKA